MKDSVKSEYKGSTGIGTIHGDHWTFSAVDGGSTEYVYCLLSRLVAGCIRFFHPDLVLKRFGDAVSGEGVRDLRSNFPDAGDASGGRISVWDDGRPVWAAADVDGQCTDLHAV